MPGAMEESRRIMDFIAYEISPDTYVNIMGQYYPAGNVSKEKYLEINRPLNKTELADVQEYAAALELLL